MTDAQLLEQAQQGDQLAWQTLYERLLPAVWRAAFARLQDETVTEDIVSETFLALVRQLSSIDPETFRLYGWVHGVLRNKIIDHIRRQSVRSRALEQIKNNQQQQNSNNSDPSETAITEEKRALVTDILDQLRDDQRVVLEMKYVDGLRVRNIAERLDLTEKSVESLLYRARQEFRKKYEFQSQDNAAPITLFQSPQPKGQSSHL